MNTVLEPEAHFQIPMWVQSMLADLHVIKMQNVLITPIGQQVVGVEQ